jgi:hypothetical protein
MSPPLDPARLYDIKKAFEYYQYDVEVEDLKPNDFKWLLEFVGALLKYVEYQKGIIFEQAGGLKELGVSMDTLRKEVGTFMRKRKASGEIEGGQGRSKRVKSKFKNDGGSQRSPSEDSEDGGIRLNGSRSEDSEDEGSRSKRSRSEDSEDGGGRSKKTRRSEPKDNASGPRRSYGGETENKGGKSKRQRKA